MCNLFNEDYIFGVVILGYFYFCDVRSIFKKYLYETLVFVKPEYALNLDRTRSPRHSNSEYLE